MPFFFIASHLFLVFSQVCQTEGVNGVPCADQNAAGGGVHADEPELLAVGHVANETVDITWNKDNKR